MERKQTFLVRASGIFAMLILLSACVGKDEAKLKVKIQGMENKTAVFQEQRVNGIKLVDSLVFSKNASIDYTFKIHQPSFYNLEIPNGADIFFLIFPKDIIKVRASGDGNINSLNIEGSDESMKLNVLYDSLFKTREILKQIRLDYSSASDTAMRNALQLKYESELEKYRRFSMQFVLENLQSLVSIAALYQEVGPDEFVFGRRRDLQFFKLVSDSLIKKFPKHRHLLALKRNFETMMESVQYERIMNSVDKVNEGLPELELPSISGDMKVLSEIGGRYILLNFYTHTAQSNSQIFPILRANYKRYATKGFNIYNVYLGKSPDAWKKIVNFEEINEWVNVADTSFPYSKTRIAYNVSAIPSNYLIDMQNKSILKKDINPQELEGVLKTLID